MRRGVQALRGRPFQPCNLQVTSQSRVRVIRRVLEGDGAGGCMGTPDSHWFTCLREENSVETVRRNLPVFLFRFL